MSNIDLKAFIETLHVELETHRPVWSSRIDAGAESTKAMLWASASIILDYFGDSISPREIKALSRSRTYAPGDPFSDFTDTYFRDLIAGLARRGYDWREKDYPLSGKGLKTGLTEIERSLDAGIPVMIDTSPDDGGHTFVVAGYSVANRALFAVDPNKPYPGLRVVGFPELEGVWNSLAAGSGVRAAVFPKPRRKP